MMNDIKKHFINQFKTILTMSVRTNIFMTILGVLLILSSCQKETLVPIEASANENAINMVEEELSFVNGGEIDLSEVPFFLQVNPCTTENPEGLDASLSLQANEAFEGECGELLSSTMSIVIDDGMGEPIEQNIEGFEELALFIPNEAPYWEATVSLSVTYEGCGTYEMGFCLSREGEGETYELTVSACGELPVGPIFAGAGSMSPCGGAMIMVLPVKGGPNG